MKPLFLYQSKKTLSIQYQVRNEKSKEKLSAKQGENVMRFTEIHIYYINVFYALYLNLIR